MDIIGGMGGGGGGGGHTPVEQNDTLRSKQTYRLLFAVNDDEMDDVQEVYLNRTPIANFNGSSYDWRPGTPDQTVIDGFSETESPIAGFSAVLITTTAPYTRSVDYDVTAVRITLTLTALRKFLDNGDIVGYTVELTASRKDNSGAVKINYADIIKKGKASSAYSWDVRIPRPAGATPGQQWQFVIDRVTGDDATTKTNSVTQISAITEIRHITPALNYPNTSLIGITLADAEQFGGRIPEITFKCRGRKIYLPTNYNPVTRVYDEGVPWDLSFKIYTEWTDNPIWHVYNVLTQKMGIEFTDIDIGSFYNEAKYADQLISDGNGGTEPRFTINNQFYLRENQPTFLMYLLTLCNAQFSSNEFGQITIFSDRAGQSVSKIVNNTNVVDGKFIYSSNDLENRYSLVNVTYNDPYQLGDTSTVTEDDDNLLDRYGLQPTDIVLAGCYSQAQAIRKSRWALWANSYDTEIVSFSVGLAGMAYHIGELVKIQDARNSGFEHQGLILAASDNGAATTLTLDRPLALGAETYTVTFLAADAVTVTEKTISETNGTFSQITFAGVTLPLVRGPFTLETATKKTFIGRVASIKKDGDAYSISVVRHNEDKYAYIEGTVTAPPPSADFVNLAGLTVSAPENVSVSEVFASNGVTATSKLHVEWDWDITGAAKYQARYQLLWRRDNQAWNSVNDIGVKEYDIENPVPGQYDFVVYAINPVANIKSAGSTIYVYSYRNDVAQSSLDPVITVVVQGTAGLIFDTADLLLDIQHNPANDSKTDKLLDYVVEVWTADGSTLKNTYVVNPDTSKNGLFKFTLAENRQVFGTPTREFQCKIYCRDLVGDLSTAKAVTVSNPAPTIATFEVSPVLEAVYIKSVSNDVDVVGYVFRRYAAATGGSALTPVLNSKTNIVDYKLSAGDVGITFYYTAAAVDAFGEGSETARQSSTSYSAVFDTYAYSGLQFTPNSPSANKVSWGAFQYSKNGATPVSVAAGSMATAWISGTIYLYLNTTTNTVEQTTSPQVAVTGRILATYQGGTNLTHDEGRAFFSGDQVLAGSMLASAFAADVAYFTNLVQMGGLIQSDGFSWTAGNYNGWRIDNSGLARFTAMEVRNPANGDIIMSVGTGNEPKYFDWGYIYGTGKPENNATVGADFTTNVKNSPTFIETFESGDTSNWVNYSGSGELAIYSTTDSQVGGKLLYIGNNSGDDRVLIVHKNNIPYNPSALYRIKFRVRKPYGVGSFYLGVAGIASDGVTFVSISGDPIASNQHYVAAVAENPTASWNWLEYIGYFTGIAATGTTATNPTIDNPRVLHQDVKYIRPTIIANYPNETGRLDVDYCSIEIIADKMVWNGVTGFGKPADNATKNTIYRQSTAPTSGMSVNDIWFDTSTLNPKTYSYNGSSWVLAGDITSNNPQSPGWLTDPVPWSGNKISTGNISSFFEVAAIGSAYIGSINLVGTSNFAVKTATSGARMDMDSRRIKVYDSSGTLRVQLGDLSI